MGIVSAQSAQHECSPSRLTPSRPGPDPGPHRWSEEEVPDQVRDSGMKGDQSGTRPTLGGRDGTFCRKCLMVQPTSIGCDLRNVVMRPPAGRVGRGPGWSPGANLL